MNLNYIFEIVMQDGAIIKNEIELPEIYEIHLVDGTVINCK